jgi:hypothetical protein
VYCVRRDRTEFIVSLARVEQLAPGVTGGLREIGLTLEMLGPHWVRRLSGG